MTRLNQLALVCVAGLLAGPALAAPDAVTEWNEIAGNAVAVGRPGAIGQVDLALVQAAVHDTIQSYEKRFEPYYAEVKPAGSKVAAAVAAAHGVLVGFYPAQAATLDATYGTYLANKGLTGNPGVAVGEAVAALYLPLRRLDPNPLPAPFTGGTGIGQWRPTESFIDTRVPRTGDRARLLALANIAGADALITSWDSKRFYFVWRPVTAIREGDNDGNPATAGDTAWQSLVNNPNYPDYSSGANSITGAMTKALELYFGRDDIHFVLTSNAPAAIKKTRNYSSFSAVAAQCVNARVYLGIHFRFADLAARTQGQKTAEFVHDHFLLPVAN